MTPHLSFNQQIVDEFRANGGQVGGPFEGARLLLLTTTGARSGRPHTAPLGYLPDGGERVLVIASAAGAPRHPAWFHNLLADPRVTVEDGTFTYEARAVVLEGDERDHLFARAVEADPGWADYQAATSRVLPVVALVQAGGGPPPAASPGEMLRLVHDAFRRELRLVREEVASSGTSLGAQLRVNCLTVCQGLQHHHTMEDAGLFPWLASTYPEVAGTIERLTAEHERVVELLADLQQAISEPPAEGARRDHVLREVDRLTAEVLAHLDYEEEQLVPLLT